MVRNACRRWKQDETTVFSLAFFIVIHRRFPWCSPAIPRMVMWCLTLRPSTTALATWKLFGWESWNLHSEMQMTETGPSITLHDHSLIYSEFFRGGSGGKVLFPQAVGPEQLMCGRQIDWFGGAIWRCCFLVFHFGLLLRIDGQCFFPVGWEMPKKIWVDTIGGYTAWHSMGWRDAKEKVRNFVIRWAARGHCIHKAACNLDIPTAIAIIMPISRISKTGMSMNHLETGLIYKIQLLFIMFHSILLCCLGLPSGVKSFVIGMLPRFPRRGMPWQGSAVSKAQDLRCDLGGHGKLPKFIVKMIRTTCLKDTFSQIVRNLEFLPSFLST